MSREELIRTMRLYYQRPLHLRGVTLRWMEESTDEELNQLFKFLKHMYGDYVDQIVPIAPKVYKFEVNDIGDISDGDHTFKELYHHRMVLFSVICNTYSNRAWKSWKHDDGTMFEGYFIVGITTPEGEYSYHYSKECWDRFNVIELENAPKWDGHMPADIDRLCSLFNEGGI